MEYRQNDQLNLAAEFVQYTNQNIFLTGKAGTGKTTFLHNLKKITPKRMVVVAPTGVAAINAGGVTIHSFFQLSFAPAIPGSALPGKSDAGTERFTRKFNREKINVIKCIDLLVIDEISMVRADVLDAVDEVLRKYRNPSRPFGGVQLLMIGDLHQLSPVIRGDEWNILKDHYNSIYFFDSLALKKTNPVTIELKEIFRQSDASFISLLNKVRENEISAQTVKELNSRHIPGFNPKDDEGFITLTTHNANAFEMNRARLAGIPGESYFFTAEITGDFPAQNFPTEEKLELKPLAQVMFIKNDLSADKQFYNGKIGKITRIEDDIVYVKCPSDESEIAAGPVTWENVKYSLNEETKEIKEDLAGSFTQIPLKLAWAITIHKSQGLTFDKVIIDASAAFAYGQVYVALSRCRSFGGIVLSTPISGSGIKTNSLVANYSNEARQKEPGPGKLLESKYIFQKELFFELFDFKLTRYRFDNLLKLVRENVKILDAALLNDLHARRALCDAELFGVADKFKVQITRLMEPAVLPEENQGLQARAKEASAYFASNLKKMVKPFLEEISIDTDNKAIRKLLAESLEKFRKEVFIKISCLENCRDGFETISYIKMKSMADIDFHPASTKRTWDHLQVSKNILYPELYRSIRDWRNSIADELGIPAYMVLPQKSIVELMKKLPTTLPGLRTIKGIGQVKLNQYGREIIAIITEFCNGNNIVPEQVAIPLEDKKPKINSGKVSYEMFVSGKTIPEIAAERNLSVSTIEGHLALYVGRGELEVSEFVSAEKLQKVLQYINENPTITLGEIKNHMGETVTYAELKFIIQHIRSQEK